MPVCVVAGLERYKIMKVVQKQPILIAEVEMMPAEDDASPKVAPLPFRVCSPNRCTCTVCHVAGL